MASQAEIRERINAKIIESLKAGCPPWRKPWGDGAPGLPKNASTGKMYHGINIVLLEQVALERGYSSQTWATFNQWLALGCQVKRRPPEIAPGEWGARIVFFKPIRKTTKDEEGDEHEERFFVLKEYSVFNAEQVSGPGVEKFLWHPRHTPDFVDFEPAEKVVAATGAEIRFGGNRAFYNYPPLDFIQVPEKEVFFSEADYYSTVLHEIAHWSGWRLGRKLSYAMEELVAEISAAYLSTEIGIPQGDDLSNSVKYLDSWLKELSDPRAIFKAAAEASKATDYILSFSQNGTSQPSDRTDADVSETLAVPYSEEPEKRMTT